MLKLAKWAYDLGVQQERVRIARALENELYEQYTRRTATYEMLNDEKSRIGKERKFKLELALEASNRVASIISAILNPKEVWETSVSVMFPEKKGKK